MKRYKDMQDRKNDWERLIGEKRTENTVKSDFIGMRQMAFEQKINLADLLITPIERPI